MSWFPSHILRSSRAARKRPSRRPTWSPSVVDGFALEPRLLLTSVLMRGYDAGTTGANLQETILNRQNVNATSFGKLTVLPTDGYVYTQPLYVPNVTIPGVGTKNVVYVATEHDSVYAFDADTDSGGSTAPLWKASFLDPANGVTSVPEVDVNTGGRDIVPEIGITGTPVIDAATKTLYVVAKTKEVSGDQTNYVQRLHALDITTGAERQNSPVVIQASVPGSGEGSVNGMIPFNGLTQNQRAGLSLVNGVVYIAWASHGDNQPYHGWVMGYDAATLAQRAVLNVSPKGEGGGIWMSGSPISYDSQGNLFLVTGDGAYSANTGGSEYGDTAVKLTFQNNTLQVADWFTPFNQAALDAGDIDLGSGGMLLLPDQPGPHPHLAMFSGKEGRIYVVDRDNLGKFNAADDSQIVQTLPLVLGGGSFATPVYFNNTVYFSANGSSIKAFGLNNGLLTTSPTAESSQHYNFPGAAMSVSANGSTEGILWATQFAANNGILRAYDASNLSRVLYDNSVVGARDQISGTVKFNPPTVVNGRVYVGLKDGLALFGLLSIASTPPSAPTTLTAQAAGVARISLTWMDTSTDEGGFKIERSTDGVNFTQIAVAPPNATTFLDTALASSKTYWYRVRATNSAGDSAFTNVANATTVASTLDPTLVAYWALDEGTGVTISDGTGHGHDGTLSGEATWIEGQVGPAAISFHDVGNTYQKISVPNAPNLQFTAVDSYTLSTWANVYDVPTRWSGVVTKSREINPWYGIWISDSGNWVAGAANNLVGPTATVGWHFVSVVQDAAAGTRSLYVDGQFAASGPAADGNGSGELWIGGAAGTNEYFNGAVDDVRLYSRALTPSEISALAFGSNPAAPTDLIATPGNAQVALSWADRSTNETGYELERSTDGVNYTRIATLGMNATSYVDTNLSAQLYWYRVRAVNATGVSAYSNIASTQPLVPAPTAPAGLSAVALTPTNVVLSWTNTSSTATAVEVERSTDGGTFSRIASLGATAITYTDTTVSAGSNYFYRVRAVASGSTVSPYSSVVQVSTLSAGLVARWTFDEGTGTTAADATGLGHTATLTPSAAWTGGQVGGAAVTFSGGAKAVVNDAPDLRFTAGQSFTLSTWANVLALTSAWSAIVAKSRDSGPWYGIWISSANTWVAGGPVNLNGPKVTTGWHSLVLVQDAAAGSRSLYVDGQLAVSGPAQDGTGGSALTMGGANAVNEPFNGSLDDTRLYSRALSPAEIASLASSFNPAAPTNLIATPGNAQVALSWVDRSTVAADSAALVRNRILQQAATAILAQANQQPALALTLLRE